MSIVRNFNGRRIIEPGVYAQIKSGIPARSNNFPFGDVMIIDTGSGKNWGGGSGINGELESGLSSVYSFEDPNDFRNFIKGGMIWDFSEFIFNPLIGAPSPEKVYFARAATTTSAKINVNLTAGSFSLICRNEGKVGNGVLDEVRAKSFVFLIDSSIQESNSLTITADDTSTTVDIVSTLAVPASTTPSAYKKLVVDEINSGTSSHGYYAEFSGLNILIYAPENSGASANNFSLSITGTVTSGATTVGFSGGVDGEKLSKGYGLKIRQGDIDSDKFIIEIHRGNYSGNSESGYHYNNLTPQETDSEIISRSPEMTFISEALDWAENNVILNKSFKLDTESFSIIGGGAFASADLTSDPDFILAVGGTEVYSPADLDEVLTQIRELGNTFFLADNFGENAISVNNEKILDHIINDAEFDKFMIIGAGKDENEFQDSLDVASHYNSEKVIVVHGGNKRKDKVNGGEEELPSIYHAANVAGRLGGLEPQVPLTFKSLRIKNFLHDLTKSQREQALQGGVLHNRFVTGVGNVVNQGINSLQNNENLINPDGTSFEISIMAIGAQLNKELILNLRPLFIGQNRGRITKADVKSFVEGYLLSRTSTDEENNLIIKFENVDVTYVDGDYNVSYGYYPNGPINRVFITGFMLDTNL